MAKNPIRAAKQRLEQRPLDDWYMTVGEEWLKHYDPSDPPEVESLLRIRAFVKDVDTDNPEQVSACLKAIALTAQKSLTIAA